MTIRQELLRRFKQQVNGPGNQPTLIRIDKSQHDRPHLACYLNIEVLDEEVGSLRLHCTTIPLSESLMDLIRYRGGDIRKTDYGMDAVIPLSVADASFIDDLASGVQRLVEKGRSYENRNWVWACPRTASCLRRLAKIVHSIYERRESYWLDCLS